MTANELKIKVSFGLCLLAIVHATVMAGCLLLGQPGREHRDSGKPVANYFPRSHSDPLDDIFYRPITANGVNTEAQDELKQSILDEPKEQCLNCPQLPQQRPLPSRVYPIAQPQPTLAPALPSSTYAPPAPQIVTPGVKRYQFMLFYDQSEASRTLLQWLQSDPRFVKMRQGSSVTSVQYYSADNPLYRSRYAKAIPLDQFPMVVLTDKDGGHIHAAGGNFLPTSSDQLYADMVKGLELYNQAKQAAPAQGLIGSGAIKSFGYSFSPAVHPAMRLQEEDCPDGICPPDQYDDDSSNSERWLDGLFPNKSPKSIVTWASGGEYVIVIAGLALLIVIVVLGVALVRRLA